MDRTTRERIVVIPLISRYTITKRINKDIL